MVHEMDCAVPRKFSVRCQDCPLYRLCTYLSVNAKHVSSSTLLIFNDCMMFRTKV